MINEFGSLNHLESYKISPWLVTRRFQKFAAFSGSKLYPGIGPRYPKNVVKLANSEVSVLNVQPHLFSAHGNESANLRGQSTMGTPWKAVKDTAGSYCSPKADTYRFGEDEDYEFDPLGSTISC